MQRKTIRAAGPHIPPAWEPADAGAIQALARGDASPHLQQRALKWIIEAAAGTYEPTYQPDSDRATAFAEGRRFVGLQMVKLLKLDINQMTKDRD